MNLRRLGPALAVFTLVLVASSTAKAQWGFGGGLGWGGWGWANGAYTVDPPPYFSMFPPVYYSHVTPRPYGFSPFAYPGFMPTPERIPMPSTRYVPPRRQAMGKPQPANVTRAVIIKNPFVDEPPVEVADARPAPTQQESPAPEAPASTAQIDLDR